MTITHYRSSSKGGKVLPIVEMEPTHLANAIAKMEREGGLTNIAVLRALRAEQKRRGEVKP